MTFSGQPVRADEGPTDVPEIEHPRSGLVGVVQEAPFALFGLAGVAILAFFAVNGSGYKPVVWYPGALAFAAVLCFVGFSLRRRQWPDTPTLAAIGALTAFTLLNYASIGWAVVRADAFAGANRTLLYASVFALFAAIPWRERAAVLVVGAYSLSVTAVAVVTFLRALEATDRSSFFIDGRFSETAGYPNAQAAILVAAAFPLVYIASRGFVHAVFRALALSAATALLSLSLLSQSRGSVAATAVCSVLFVILVSGRGRAVIALAMTAATVAIAAGPMLAVYGATSDTESALSAALRHAGSRLALAAGVAAAIGLLWALADSRITISPRMHRSISVAMAVVAALIVVASLVAVISVGRPVGRVQEGWQSFSKGRSPAIDQSRFTSLGSNRYDFYRVALREFQAHPLLGVGSDNFAVDYVRERRSEEEPLYPHSILIRIPAQFGIVGSALALAFVVLVGWALLAARRTPAWRTSAALLTAFLYWAAHGSFDWFWAFPGLTAPAFMMLGIAVGLAPRPPRGERSFPRAARIAVRVGSLALLAAIAVTLAFPWLSAVDVQRASDQWRADPSQAVATLQQAARLNPFDEQPYVVAAVIARRSGDDRAAIVELERAVRRNPSNWYATLELGVMRMNEGSRADAAALLDRARNLNPSEPTIHLALSRLRAGKQLDLEALDRAYQARLQKRIGSGLATG